MRFGRVGASEDNVPGQRNIRVGCGGRAGSGDRLKGQRGGGMADTRAAIHIVRSDACAEEFLKQIGGFIRGAGRSKRSKSLWAKPIAEFLQAPGQPGNCLWPRDFAPAACGAQQWPGEAVPGMVVAVGVASLDAKVPVIDLGEWGAANASDATVGHVDI